MSQKAVEDVLSRVNRLVGWWDEQRRITGKAHRTITLTDKDVGVLKADMPTARLAGVIFEEGGAVHYRDFELVAQSFKPKEEEKL